MKNSAIDSFFNSASDPEVAGKFRQAILAEKNDFKSPKMATQGLPTLMTLNKTSLVDPPPLPTFSTCTLVTSNQNYNAKQTPLNF